MPKPKTKAQLDRAADLHRQKKYGVGLDYYDKQLDAQSGGCAVCGVPPGARRLHIDHDHGWTKIRVESVKISEAWAARATYNGTLYLGGGRTKSHAIRAVKAQLKKSSVRGLLCYQHNVGLQKFQDNPKYLRAAAQYLENHQEAA